jgi:hypothetical protein
MGNWPDWASAGHGDYIIGLVYLKGILTYKINQGVVANPSIFGLHKGGQV